MIGNLLPLLSYILAHKSQDFSTINLVRFNPGAGFFAQPQSRRRSESQPVLGASLKEIGQLERDSLSTAFIFAMKV